jgi:signal transduction histidine kinase
MFLSIIFAGNIHAQKAKVDSLENVLKLHSAEDTVKVKLLNEIAYIVNNNNLEKSLNYATQAGKLADELKFLKGKVESLWLIGIYYTKSDRSLALDYTQRALEMSEEINYKLGIAKSLNCLGATYKLQGKYEQALEHHQRAIEVYEEMNDQSGIAKNLTNIAMVYTAKGNYPKAIDCLQKSLILFEKLNDKKLTATCLSSLGIIFTYQANYTEALVYFQKSLKISEALNEKSGIFAGLLHIGATYKTIDDNQQALEEYQKALSVAEELKDKRMILTCYSNIGKVYQQHPQALEYYQKGLNLSEEISDKSSTIFSLRNIGEFYLAQGNYPKAFEHLQKGLKIAEGIGDKRNICLLDSKIGELYFKQKKYASALNYSIKSLEIANKMDLLSDQKNIHNQLSEIYSATQDYKNAYIHHKTYKALNDSIFNESNIKKITGLEYTYKFEKEKQAIELEQQKRDAIQSSEQKQQQIIMFSFIGGFILMFFLAIVAIRSNQLKNKTNVVLIRQKSEIEEKNEELLHLNEEVSAQRDEITAQKAEIEVSNVKLQELNDTKDKFFGIIAHDLKNPFNAILGFSNLLVDPGTPYKQEETMECVGLIHSSAQSAYKLLENLLEWSKSQTGSIDFKPQHLVIKAIADETIHLCESLAIAKNISIRNEIPDGLSVFVDRNMLNTTLRNLITNAIKFTRKGGSVTIASLEQQAEVEITVRDTGIGMDEKTRSKLFRINEKISRLGTADEKGTGLGLLLCKEFVEKHGGRIWAESELDKGSAFKFTMPLRG